MTKIDLITGFLGAGKTTFIRKYAQYLMDEGQKIGILENDYGAVNVDMMLLSDLEGEQCMLEMVSGGCDADCHRRRFKTKLIALGMSGLDRVIIEPSGLFDVDEFFDVLHEEPLDRWYTIGSVLAIVDANLPEELSKLSEYMLASQIAEAGRVIFSRSGSVTYERMQGTVDHLNRALTGVRCGRRFSLDDSEQGDLVVRKDWEYFTGEDLRELRESGIVLEDYVKKYRSFEDGFQSVSFLNPGMTPEQVKLFAEEVFGNPSMGNLVRIKGFVPLEDSRWIRVNGIRGQFRQEETDAGQDVLILIGEGLDEEEIRRCRRRLLCE